MFGKGTQSMVDVKAAGNRELRASVPRGVCAVLDEVPKPVDAGVLWSGPQVDGRAEGQSVSAEYHRKLLDLASPAAGQDPMPPEQKNAAVQSLLKNATFGKT